MLQRYSAVGVACCLAVYFLYCTWPALLVGFDDDDVMNLHFAWTPPLGSLIVSNLVPFTPLYRPAGAAYYRICFALFGWNPAAFRTVTFVLMAVNIVLVYLLAKRLTKSSEIAVLSALVFSYHPKLRQIYMSNGAVYDVLCATLSLLLLLYYMRLRERRDPWKWWECAALIALFIGALNAKEMAAILPAILLVYEWLYYPPSSRTARGLGAWIWKSGRTAALLALLALSAFWGKRQPGGAFFRQPLYSPEFTLHRFFEHQRGLMKDLFLIPDHGFNTTKLVICFAIVLLIAALARKRYIWFSALFALLAPFPVIFVPFRGFFVMYLPIAGWAMLGAALVVNGRDWLWRVLWMRPPIAIGAWQPERVFTFAAIAFILIQGRNRDDSTTLVPYPSGSYVAGAHADLMRLNERLPEGAQVLLLRSRYPDVSWGPMQMMQLLYRDRKLVVERPSMMEVQPDLASYEYYDRVIDFNGRDLVVVYRKISTAQKGRLPG